MTIIDIRYTTTPTLKQVTCKADYDKVQKYVYDHKKILIPPWSLLDIMQKGNIVVFIEPWECEIEILESDRRKILKYRAEVGFISDKGSVPPYLRSFVDNDDPQFLIPYYIHDINYACHYMSRGDSDKLLRDMGKYNGAGIYKSSKVYYAVYFGGSNAYKKSDRELQNERKYSNFSYTYKTLK